MRARAGTETTAAAGTRPGRWLWGATGALLVALAVSAAFWDPWAWPGPVVCAFRRATGIACPACGLTRAAALFAHGRFAESLAVHPAFPLLAIEAALAWLLWGERLATGRRRLERWASPILLATVAALLLLWVVRWWTGRLPA